MNVAKELIVRLRELKQLKAEAEDAIKQLEGELAELCLERQSKYLETDIDGQKVTATMVQPTRVVWNNEVAKEELGDQWKEVVTITEKVDSQKIDDLLAEGIISQETVSKMADLKLTRAYFRLS